jgi:type II secretory pathway pseudopilin PulG
MKQTYKRYIPPVVLLAVGITTTIGAVYAGGWPDSDERLTQSAELEQQLHAAFHAAVSVRDPVSGDSQEVITQRIREAIALWTKDGVIQVVSTSTTGGNYIGRGDPDDPATCPEPTGDTSADGQQGTLCTFFKYVSGGMQIANKFVSLSPAYKTRYVPVRDRAGKWKSSVYFECHYFDVSLNPATGQPFWTAKSHVDLDGEAKKVGGRWLFTQVTSSAVGVPVP